MSKKPRPVLPSDYWDPKNAKEGQRRINAQLVNVDQMIIEAIRELRAEIAKFPGSAKAADLNLKRIDEMLNEADRTSGKIAHIEPPGCDPRYPPDPPRNDPPKTAS